MLRAVAEAPTGLLRDPILLAQTVMLELAIFVLDALTLWLAFRALGRHSAIVGRFCQLRHGVDRGNSWTDPFGSRHI